MAKHTVRLCSCWKHIALAYSFRHFDEILTVILIGAPDTVGLEKLNHYADTSQQGAQLLLTNHLVQFCCV